MKRQFWSFLLIVGLHGAALWAAAPVITSVTPSEGPTAGGNSVVIAGTGLSGATSVTFGGTVAGISNNTATQITVLAPPHAAGAVDVRVVTPSGFALKPGGYAYSLFKVTSMIPAPNSVMSGAPANIVLTFSQSIDPLSVTNSTVVISGAGGDGQFGTGDDQIITPSNVGILTNSVTLSIPPGSMTNGRYRVRVAGDGSAPPTSVEYPYTFQSTSGNMVFGDLDMDGIPEMIATFLTTIDIFKGTGTGGFGPPVSLASPGSWVNVVDLNGDGKPEVCEIQNARAHFARNTNTTSGVLSLAPFAQAVGGIGGTSAKLLFSDFNGDGKPDAFACDSTSVNTTANRTDPGASGIEFYSSTQSYTHASNSFAPGLGDINGDGKADIVEFNGAWINGTAQGVLQSSFGTRIGLAAVGSRSVRLADFNGDDKLDLIGSTSSNIAIALNTTPDLSTTPSFAAAVSISPGATISDDLGVGDINGDGKPDFVVACNSQDDVRLFLNTTPVGAATPTFAPAIRIPFNNPRGVQMADMTGSGKIGLAVLDLYSVHIIFPIPTSSLSIYGDALDGEFSGTFPSGNGTPGGDFIAEFSLGNSITVAADASANFSAADQPVTLTATVTSSEGTVNTGTVTFQLKNGATNVGTAATSATLTNGAASVSYTLPGGTPAGSYSINAGYSGGGTFQSSFDNSKRLSVIATTSLTTAVPAASFQTGAQNVMLITTVTSPGGVVNTGTVTLQLKNGAANVGTANPVSVQSDGTASTNYNLPPGTPAGTYTIYASYNGSTFFLASANNTQTVTVDPAATTTTAANLSTPYSDNAQNLTFNASVTSPAGTVNEGVVTFQLKNGAVPVGAQVASPTLTNGSASVNFTLPPGTPIGIYSIEAAYAGANFAASSDNTRKLTVQAAGGVAAENATLTYKTGSQTVTLNATVTAAGGPVNEGTITFQVKNGAANVGTAVTSATVSNGSVSVTYTLPGGTASGQYSINAAYSGSANFAPGADNSRILTIERAPSSVAANSIGAVYSASNQNVTLTAQVSSPNGSINEGAITFVLKSGAQQIGVPVTSSTVVNGNAGASYSVPGGTIPGDYTIQADYNGGTNFTPASDSSKTLTISKAAPAISWNNPANIVYGTPLGAAELNATATVPGTFDYSPAAGTVPGVGTNQNLSVTFTPNDTVRYTGATKSVLITVTKKTLTVTADNKSKILNSPNPPLTASYSGFVEGDTAAVLTGTPALSTTAVQGSPIGGYTITAAAGTLAAASYTFTFVNGTLTVTATPEFTDLSAPDVPYGTPNTNLGGRISFGAAGSIAITFNGSTQNAPIDGSGSFSASFNIGSLELGSFPIQYNFPGGGGLDPASAARTLKIVKAAPALTWNNPADIEYGTALGAAQLNATAGIPGTFTYDPAAGTILPMGTHTLSTVFQPSDAGHYVSAGASVSIRIGKTTPNVVWPTPADIPYGIQLSETQLNATCSLPGAFVYNPPAGTILAVGSAQLMSVTFTPQDSNYSVKVVTVLINVLKADQTIAFDTIPDQEAGGPPIQLTAAATSNLPVALTLVSGPAILNGTQLTPAGLGAVTVRAEQSGNDFFNAASPVDRTFNIVVIPPHITSALTASGTQNSPFTYTMTASGTKPLTLSAAAVPTGLTFEPVTGILSGTPAGSGAFQIALTASNAAGAETKILIAIFASSGGGENHAPSFASRATALPNPATAGQEVVFFASGSDADGDSIALSWDFGDGAQGFGATVTHRYSAAGVFAVKVTVTDGVASDYLNLTVVVNSATIPAEQYQQYTVSKLGLKFNFAKQNADALTISGTIPVPAAFAPEGKIVKFESGALQREWTLDKKATSADKAFKLTAKFAKDGTITASPAKFALNLKNQALFTPLAALGFTNDNTPKGMIVPMPVILRLNGIGYLVIVDVNYAAKKDKSGTGKK